MLRVLGICLAGLGLSACDSAPGSSLGGAQSRPAIEVRGAPIDSAPAVSAAPIESVSEADAGSVLEAPIDELEIEIVGPDAEEPQPSVTPAAGKESSATSSTPAGHLVGVHEQADALEESERASDELTVVGDTTIVTFADLAFAKGDAVTKGDKVIPASIQGLDGKKIAVDGFMIPMDFEEDEVRSFLLTRFPPGCCFGMLPAMDQWIDVEMVSDEGADIVEMRIVRVTGALEVGEVLDDYGYLSSVYRLDAERVVSQW